jgi:hypothetical protein
LFPPGITHLADLPATLHDAISKGLAFVSFDELPSEERPPRKIWLDSERLDEWFTEVEKRRKEKYGVDGNKDIEDPVGNEAARGLIVG